MATKSDCSKQAKQRKRKAVPFLRGPVRDGLPKVDDVKSSELLICAKDALKKLTLDDGSEPKVANEKRFEARVKCELIFGLNSVLRNIGKGYVVGVVVTEPLSVNIQETICDVAMKNKVPIVFVVGLSETKSEFRLSSLTCLAFKTNVKDQLAVFNPFYLLFSRIAMQFDCNKHDSEDCQSVKNNTQLAESTTNATRIEKNVKSELIFRFAKPTFSDLYIPSNKVGDFLVQSLTNSVEAGNEVYFPQRYNEKQFNLDFGITLNGEKVKEDEQFVHKVKESAQFPGKRKRNQKKKGKDAFIETDVLHLTPSQSKVKNKNKKQKTKAK